MFRGFYTVASGMISQQRRTEMLTNNMANVNTPGFKAEQSTIRSFPEMLIESKEKTNIPTEKGLRFGNLRQHGAISTGVYMQETVPLHEQGQLKMTELTTDVALEDRLLPINENGERGTLLFRLDDGNGGEIYTRNGNLTVDVDGYLTAASGHYILGTNGERIRVQNDDFQVDESGTIFVNGNELATISVAYTENPNEQLYKQEDGSFITVEDEALAEANAVDGIAYGIQQGYVEGSTVDASRTMTDMLSAYRAFEANQKVLQAYDRSMEKAVNEIGRLT